VDQAQIECCSFCGEDKVMVASKNPHRGCSTSALGSSCNRVPASRDSRHARGRDRRGDQRGGHHLGDSAAGTLDREIDYTLEEHSEQVLGQIDAALVRIEDGTYGTCTNCGKPIPEDRLEARPWASLCIDCQRAAERS
jgi:RNA polymerase-binding protein DksA